MHFQPVDLNALLGILIGGAFILTPMFAFAVRFAFRPLLESLIKLKEGVDGRELDFLRRRVALLERRVAELDGKPLQLIESETFPVNGELRQTRERA